MWGFSASLSSFSYLRFNYRCFKTKAVCRAGEKQNWRARELIQWLEASIAFAKDPSSILNTHVGQVTTTCNSSSRGPISSWPPWVLHSCEDTHTDTHMHIILKIIKINSLFFKNRRVQDSEPGYWDNFHFIKDHAAPTPQVEIPCHREFYKSAGSTLI